MNKLRLILFFIFLSRIVISQDSIFIDSRDGNSYPIILLGETLWFGTNLVLETPKSWCAEHGNTEDCANGNFYYNTIFLATCI